MSRLESPGKIDGIVGAKRHDTLELTPWPLPEPAEPDPGEGKNQ